MAKIEKYARWDFKKALAEAKKEKLAWRKCIALSWVARFGPEQHLAETVDAAVFAASKELDHYNAVYPLAWPLRALLEQGHVEAASGLLDVLIKKSGGVIPRSSESEALFLIFQASIYGQDTLWPIAFRALVEASLPIEHWRQKRNIRDAVLMVADRDTKTARNAAEKIQDDRLRESILLKLASGNFLQPRKFFW